MVRIYFSQLLLYNPFWAAFGSVRSFLELLRVFLGEGGCCGGEGAMELMGDVWMVLVCVMDEVWRGIGESGGEIWEEGGVSAGGLRSGDVWVELVLDAVDRGLRRGEVLEEGDLLKMVHWGLEKKG